MTKTFRLYSYQSELMARLREAWQAHRSVMAQMPTGTGKTVVLAALVSEECGAGSEKCSDASVAIVAHRRKPVEQIEETVGRYGISIKDGRVTVPPVYHNIKPPVGRYCTVEKNYSLWGVVAVDGTVMVGPQYSDIEIGLKGDVTGTKTTEKKVSVKLP